MYKTNILKLTWKLANFNIFLLFNKISNKIIIISEDILYLYDDDRGLVPIVQSNELNYNYENICDYKEKKWFFSFFVDI